mgnify:CR=1 FL=1
MTDLAEIVRENVGKNSLSMRLFFQGLIDNGEIKAYSFEIDKSTVEKDTDDEKVIRIKKGLTLEEVKKLAEYQPVFIEDVNKGSMYYLHISSHGGMFDDEGGQTIYNNCSLERLASGFNPRLISGGYRNENSGISIPEDMIVARLRVNYSDDWEAGADVDYIADRRGSTVVEGKRDKLFDNVLEFVRKR